MRASKKLGIPHAQERELIRERKRLKRQVVFDPGWWLLGGLRPSGPRSKDIAKFQRET